LFEFNGQIIGYGKRPAALAGVPSLFILYIDGTSMEPWARHGSPVLIHPGAPVRIGDRVLVEMHPEDGQEDGLRRAYIKELVRRTETKLILRQYNPEEEKALPAKRVKAVMRVWEMSDLIGG
jgi:phage repressor protein C with HTH and peptisase S24 domain